jgi:hypothetical protein
MDDATHHVGNIADIEDEKGTHLRVTVAAGPVRRGTSRSASVCVAGLAAQPAQRTWYAAAAAGWSG